MTDDALDRALARGDAYMDAYLALYPVSSVPGLPDDERARQADEIHTRLLAARRAWIDLSADTEPVTEEATDA